MKMDFICSECGRNDPDGKIISSLVGIKYWVCQNHFPEKIRSRRDWTVILVNAGLWGIAVLLTLPYIIAVLK